MKDIIYRCLFFCGGMISFLIPLSAQPTHWEKIPVSLQGEQFTQIEILQQLEKCSGLSLAYPGHLLSPKDQKIAINWHGLPLKEALQSLFPDQELIFKKIGNNLIIRPEARKNILVHLHGYLTDATSGESLIGATLSVLVSDATGTATNQYGYYSLALPPGEYRIKIAYLGYRSQEQLIHLRDDRRFDFTLIPDAQSLQEVIVLGHPDLEDHLPSEVSRHRIDLEMMKSLPTIGGEADIIKAVQWQAGVNQVGEGSSGLYVRGGNLDQNLILLDDAPIYHASHLLGFFSTFHPDAIRYADLYTGNFPVQYGGRLSSVLNLRMKEGNRENWSVTGGAGLLASRLLVEGPLQKGQHSMMVAARRTYPDLFLSLFSEDEGGNKINFHDLNAKFNFTFDRNNRLFVSTYHGRDVLRFFDAYENSWGNTTATLRWNRIFSERVFANFTAVYSRYRYLIDNLVDGVVVSSWESGVRDVNIKADFTSILGPENRLYFGLENILHRFEPGKDRLQLFGSIPRSKTLEQALYLGHHRKAGKWTLDYGFRLNANHNLGKSTVFRFDQNYQLIDTVHFNKGIFHTKINLAPRLAVSYQINKHYRLQGGYSRTLQYLQELRNATTGFNAFYTYLPSGPNIAEQKADQINLGLLRSFSAPGLLASVVVYYKWLHHQVDFAPHSSLLQNPSVEGSLRTGQGKAYGLEFSLQKTSGRIKGSINYTYARSFRTIKELNDGNTFPTYYDQPHNIKIQARYIHNQRWQFAGHWLYHSGGATTLPISSYQYDGIVIPIYSERNAYRLPAFHRLDLSATLNNKPKDGRKYQSFWVFSIYNAYYRKNTFSLDILPREEAGTGNVPDPSDAAVYKTYLLSIIPAIAYNFKF